MEREHKPEGTQGLSRLEVFEKAATKKDDHNHPNSLQRGNYSNENMKISGNQAMQPSRTERLLYDSCAQDHDS